MEEALRKKVGSSTDMSQKDYETLERNFYQCLGYHLYKAGFRDRFRIYYLDLTHLALMLRYLPPSALVADFVMYEKLIGHWVGLTDENL